MPRIRRTVFLFFNRYDAPLLDPAALIRGAGKVRRMPQLLAISVLRGAEFEISERDFELLGTVPSDRWMDADELAAADRPRLRELAELGLLVSTEDDPLLAELRRRDEQLAAGPWNVYAALFHSLTKWRDVDFRRRGGGGLEELPVTPPEAVERFVGGHREPPSQFHA